VLLVFVTPKVASNSLLLVPCFVQVLPVLRTVLGTLGASHHELIRSVLTLLVSLIVSGAAGPTLDLMSDWSKVADPSLLRHFVELVRECC
jgi:hypothetical protein